uniref:peroxisomal multifunctional enzyme type 2-like n=1 Tax=Styela clava TaxID=7725 RepID=UPI0019395893|nr:peroxisomal multifunctional enzyme type 2-like [Styela clava]
MSNELRFDGKVVIVTGAGGGLGRAYALAFASRGASVVVNDLGSSRAGEGATSTLADKVVEEIRSKGGKAVANYNSVEDGEEVVQTALDHFGRIDILINNAGILRDKSFSRMTVAEWDIIHRVHLRGSFLCTKAVWEHMRKQKYGRIIMTSSAAGIYGNFGQANYSAAKLGLVGLMNSLAIEGEKYNINVNTISPVAGTRLTEGILPPEVFESLKPEFVVPIVVWLCHDECHENGGVYEAGGGFVTKIRWQRTDGAVLREKNKPMTAENIRDNWERVVDFSRNHIISTIRESTLAAAEQVMRIESGDNDLHSNHPIQPSIAMKHESEPCVHVYNSNDVIKYALGIGASTTQEDHLKFLFEMNDDFCVLPTFAVVPAFTSMVGITNVPGLSINPAKILHGEQYIEIFKPIPTSGKLTSQTKISAVLDKGSGAAVITDVDTFDESGERLFFNQFVTFAVGYGNFGGQRSSSGVKEPVKPPKRSPDASISEKTSKDQAALYRLSGDSNPLHIEPSFAAMGGFKQPILHGLCSYGYAARHVMMKYGDNDPNKIKAVKTRFAKPVLPGQTLRTDMWKEGSRIYFQTVVVETGVACLTGGYVDLVDGTGSSSSSSSSVNQAQEQPVEDKLESDALFEGVQNLINADMVKKVNAIYQWNITKNGKVTRQWALDLKNGSGSMTSGPASKPGCTLTISDDDVMLMFSGKLNPQQAFFSGRFKAAGNIMLAQKLETLFKAQAKL